MPEWYLSELRRVLVPYLVLEMLSKSQQYPYALAKALREVDDRLCYEGDLSSTFSRLEKRGYLTHEWDASELGQARKYYSITERGIAHLTSFRIDFSEILNAVDKVLAHGTRSPPQRRRTGRL